MSLSNKILMLATSTIVMIATFAIVAVPTISSGSDATVLIENDTDEIMTNSVQYAIDNTIRDEGGIIVLSIESDFSLSRTIVIDEGDIVKIVSSVEGNRAIGRVSADTAMFRVEDGGSLTFENIILDGNEISSSVSMIVVNGGEVSIDSGATIKNGNCDAVANQGGAFMIRSGNVYLKDGGAITHNTAISGGAIRIEGGTFEMNGGDLTYNSSIRNGGAIAIAGIGTVANPTPVSVMINDGDISYNHAIGTSDASITANGDSGSGGAIHMFSKDSVKSQVNVWKLIINGGTFDNNDVTGAVDKYSSGCGGAINVKAGVLEIKNATFENNSASVNGGAINIMNVPTTVTNTTFDDNEGVRGGAIYFDGNAVMKIDGGCFSNNEADGGGAISSGNGKVTIKGNTAFTGNQSSKCGGAIYANQKSELNIIAAKFSDNKTSGLGGALYFESCGQVIIGTPEFKSLFSGNKADDRGGAMYIKNTKVIIENATISENLANNGAGIYILDGSYVVNNGADIKGNIASNNGGAVSIGASSRIITYIHNAGVISDNKASGEGEKNDTGLGSAIHIFCSTITNNVSSFLVELNGGEIIGAGVKDVVSSSVDAMKFLIDINNPHVSAPTSDGSQGLFIGGTIFHEDNNVYLAKGCSFAYESSNATQGFTVGDASSVITLKNVPVTKKDNVSVGYALVKVDNDKVAPIVSDVILYSEYADIYDIDKETTTTGFDIKYTSKCIVDGKFSDLGTTGEIDHAQQYVSNGESFSDMTFAVDEGVISYYRVIDGGVAGEWNKIASPMSSFTIEGYVITGDITFEVIAEDATHAIYTVDYLCGDKKISDSKVFFGNVIGTTYELDIPSITGYTGNSDNLTSVKVTGYDMVVVLNYTINQYTITFNTIGGTVVGPIKQDYNSLVSAPADPTREGYEFGGWDSEIPKTMPLDGATINATWIPNIYKLSLYSLLNGKTTLITIVDQTFDQPYNVAGVVPADITGYTPGMWFTGNPGSEGVTEIPERYTTAEDTKIYVTYVANTDVSYTVSYVSANGLILADMKIVENQTFNTEVTEDAVSVSGYVAREGSQTMALNAYDLTIVFTYDRMVMPESKPVYCTVTVNSSVGGSTTGAGSYVEGSLVTLSVTPEPHYKFIGWYLGEERVSTEMMLTFIVTGTVEYFAQFDVNATVEEDINSDGIDSDSTSVWLYITIAVLALITTVCVVCWIYFDIKGNKNQS